MVSLFSIVAFVTNPCIVYIMNKKLKMSKKERKFVNIFTDNNLKNQITKLNQDVKVKDNSLQNQVNQLKKDVSTKDRNLKNQINQLNRDTTATDNSLKNENV